MEALKMEVCLRLVSCFIFFVMLGSPVFAGEVYRWVDTDGGVHFSDSAGIAGNSTNARRMQVRTPNLADSNHAISADQGRRDAAVQPGKRSHVAPSRKSSSVSRSANPSAKCQSVEQSLKRIRARMRAGYKAAEQQRLHERELQLMHARGDFCRQM